MIEFTCVRLFSFTLPNQAGKLPSRDRAKVNRGAVSNEVKLPPPTENTTPSPSASAPAGPMSLPATSTSGARSEEHTSELQSLMRISYAVFCLKKKQTTNTQSFILPQHHNYSEE